MTARATNSMPSRCAVVIVLRTPMPMAFVTTKMTALEHSMLAACAMALARFTSVDALDIPEGDCDCEGNQLDALARVVVIAGGQDADGICDDEDDCIGALDACGICNGPGESTMRMSDIPAGDCDCEGNQLDALGACGGVVLRTPMPMASATTSTTALARSMLAACATAPARSTSGMF